MTGATGSVGSNVCRLAAARGIAVRALVRPGSDVEPLVQCGAEPVIGDVTDRDSLAAADTRRRRRHPLCGADRRNLVHRRTADYEAVNQWGTINVLDAAQAAGAARTVVLLSAVVGDRRVTTTEDSPIAPISPENSPYLRTKLAAYYEGMARAARGVDIRFVVPGGIYGPTPMVERALVPTIFTGTLLMAARGELRRYLPMPIPWVLAEDVADIALSALERGRPVAGTWRWGGPRTRARCRSSATRSSRWPGSTSRVEEFDPTGPGAPLTPSSGRWSSMLQSSYPSPSHDPSRTTPSSVAAPTPLRDGLLATLTWLRANHKL